MAAEATSTQHSLFMYSWSETSGPKADPQKLTDKINVCAWHIKGGCKNGHNCHFIHMTVEQAEKMIQTGQMQRTLQNTRALNEQLAAQNKELIAELAKVKEENARLLAQKEQIKAALAGQLQATAECAQAVEELNGALNPAGNP